MPIDCTVLEIVTPVTGILELVTFKVHSATNPPSSVVAVRTAVPSATPFTVQVLPEEFVMIAYEEPLLIAQVIFLLLAVNGVMDATIVTVLLTYKGVEVISKLIPVTGSVLTISLFA
jgi:hypothetical protein